MIDPIAHPFQPGAKVAIVVTGDWRAPHGFKNGTVAKVLKSGRFTLEGSPQQWRPHEPNHYEKFWHASSTGEKSGSLRIMDETTIAHINEQNRKYAQYNRFKAARYAIERMPFSDSITDEVLEKLESAITIINGVKS